MKKILIAAGTLYPALLFGSLHVQSENIESAVSGSTITLGVDDEGNARGSVTHGTSIALENGEKTNERATFEAHAKFLTDLPDACTFFIFDAPVDGFRLVYEYNDSLSTLDNGDLVMGGLDPNEESSICIHLEEDTLQGIFEIRTYRIIEGGTGAAGNACGYVDFVGYGVSKGTGRLASFSGIQTGEIFMDASSAPAGTAGCDTTEI